MLNWNEIRVAQEQRQDILRDVQRRRIVAEAVAGRSHPARFYGPVLAVVGRSLVALGSLLQSRYGALVEPAPAINISHYVE